MYDNSGMSSCDFKSKLNSIKDNKVILRNQIETLRGLNIKNKNIDEYINIKMWAEIQLFDIEYDEPDIDKNSIDRYVAILSDVTKRINKYIFN